MLASHDYYWQLAPTKMVGQYFHHFGQFGTWCTMGQALLHYESHFADMMIFAHKSCKRPAKSRILLNVTDKNFKKKILVI